MISRRKYLCFGLVWLALAKAADDEIYDAVRRKLANDPDVKGGALDVQVQEGVVELRGRVRSEKAREKAERLTRRVKGVKRVINRLTVAP
jgi:hyperosmotically inducible protein